MGTSLDPLGDGKSKIELLSYIGGDLDIVNDARASFEKTSEGLSEKDINLIRYLIEHEHTSPLRGTVFKFRVKAPLFICRQWWKHVVASNHTDEQLGWNEKSFRYTQIEDLEEFYIPAHFRMQSTSNKQASEGLLEEEINGIAVSLYERACQDSFNWYKSLINLGVCREEARGVLVPSVYTSWVWTASFQSVLHFIDLRKGNGAQSQITAYSEAIEDLIRPVVPVSINIWNCRKNLIG